MEKLTIQQWRRIKGYSQQQFADLIGVSVNTYRAKEAGVRDWKVEEVKTICKHLNISIEKQLDV